MNRHTWHNQNAEPVFYFFIPTKTYFPCSIYISLHTGKLLPRILIILVFFFFTHLCTLDASQVRVAAAYLHRLSPSAHLFCTHVQTLLMLASPLWVYLHFNSQPPFLSASAVAFHTSKTHVCYSPSKTSEVPSSCVTMANKLSPGVINRTGSPLSRCVIQSQLLSILIDGPVNLNKALVTKILKPGLNNTSLYILNVQPWPKQILKVSLRTWSSGEILDWIKNTAKKKEGRGCDHIIKSGKGNIWTDGLD